MIRISKKLPPVNPTRRSDFPAETLRNLGNLVLTFSVSYGSLDNLINRNSAAILLKILSILHSSSYRTRSDIKGLIAEAAALDADSQASLTAGNSAITKRDVFYRDVELFKTQSVVDTCLDDLARGMFLARKDLGVVLSLL